MSELMIRRVIEELGGCLSDLGRVLAQGYRPDNQATRGNIASGLEKVAVFLRSATIEEALEALKARQSDARSD